MLPLLLVVLLQLTLLGFVAAAWTEDSKAANASRIASAVPGYSTDYGSYLLLAFTEIGGLCALGLYTHAEVQAAVDLFRDLRQQQRQQEAPEIASTSHLAAEASASAWLLVVPWLQLVVATLTLMVQGLVFMSYEVPASGAHRQGAVITAVSACVALAFILELDNRAWIFVRPMLVASNTIGPADKEQSLLAMLNSSWCRCDWVAEACDRIRSCLPRLRTPCEFGCVVGRLGKRLLTYLFHITLFVYECTFCMLLVVYATSYVFRAAPGVMLVAVVVGFGCAVVFQVVAGVRSDAIAGPDCHCTPAWLRPVLLNLLAPLSTAVFTRCVWEVFVRQLTVSKWRCDAGAVIGCAHTDPPCIDKTEWCISTSACRANCTMPPASTTPCLGKWCSNHSCIACLIDQNASFVPSVDLGVSSIDMAMCRGSKSYYVCMQAWMTFVPLAFVLLLASLFLGFESKWCSCRPTTPQPRAPRPPGRCSCS